MREEEEEDKHSGKALSWAGRKGEEEEAQVGNRNRRAEPTTNKLKRRLSLTLTGRSLVSPRSESQRMFCETRWSIPTVLRRGARTTVRSPLRARKARVTKNEKKKQLRSTVVTTPRLLMAAIKSIRSVPFLESLVHLTHNSLPITFFSFR